jgi:cobalamin biosynthesis Mg chelatase CobN
MKAIKKEWCGMSPNMDKMLELLKEDESLESMLAVLRDQFLDIEAVSSECGHDILGEVVSCPKHVVFYAAMQLDMMKNQKR